jgi:beta-galactosidase
MKSLCAPLALVLMFPCLTPAAAPDWFPRADLMTIGAYYYPEAWPESQWARDMANMRKLGMEFVHMGEFAWAFMNPRRASTSLTGWRKTSRWPRRTA